jgi:hypothetical protein
MWTQAAVTFPIAWSNALIPYGFISERMRCFSS